MGRDPQAILYYGIHLGAEPEDYYGMNEAWEADHAPKKPDDPDRRSSAWDAWRLKYREYLGTSAHVEIRWSGSEESYDDGFYVHCPYVQKSVEWDEHLAVSDLRVPQDADDSIRRFCERFNIPYVQPSWHLAARYA